MGGGSDELGHFYPRPPRGGRHFKFTVPFEDSEISIHALREEGDPRDGADGHGSDRISIHALREEGDRPSRCFPADYGISIHALREEGDPSVEEQLDGQIQFLSTPSARRATVEVEACNAAAVISIHALREEGDCSSGLRTTESANFYPRPPRGGRPFSNPCLCAGCAISIHALREEGDLKIMAITHDPEIFLSTPSARRATYKIKLKEYREVNFYPRPPRGGRPGIRHYVTSADGFLSTPSARRATAKTETKSLFSNKLYNILHEFRRALIYNGSKSYPNHAK